MIREANSIFGFASLPAFAQSRLTCVTIYSFSSSGAQSGPVYLTDFKSFKLDK